MPYLLTSILRDTFNRIVWHHVFWFAVNLASKFGENSRDDLLLRFFVDLSLKSPELTDSSGTQKGWDNKTLEVPAVKSPAACWKKILIRMFDDV
jgi:hypothetical protein